MARVPHTSHQLHETNTNFSATNGSPIPFNDKRRLVCVEHPAVIKNLDRGLQSLGGTKEITKTYNQDSKRLEMRCRPDDPFCKPAYGDRNATTNLLMNVKRRRKRNARHEVSYEYSVEILGIIDTTYKFQAMVDFQYLPVTRHQDGSYESLLDKLMLKSFVKKTDFLKMDVPLFLTPLIFSRMDLPCDYDFRPDRGHTLKKTEEEFYLPDSQISYVARHRRSIYTMFVSYDEPTPSKPQSGAEEFLIARFNKNTDLLEQVRKLFEERPIWSKNALRCQVHPKLECRLKYVLPLLAYYVTTGPWRSMWVRIGYNPKSTPAAKKYQLLDYRIRQRGACDQLPIKGKRGVFCYSAPMSVTRYKPSAQRIPPTPNPEVVNEFKKSIYIFDPNVMPPYRQMFYQMCDIYDREIQKIISENDGQETVCTEREGWFFKDTTNRCRQIISDRIERLLQMNPSGDATFYMPGAKQVGRTDQRTDDIESKSDDELELDLTGEETLNDMETEMLDCI